MFLSWIMVKCGLEFRIFTRFHSDKANLIRKIRNGKPQIYVL